MKLSSWDEIGERVFKMSCFLKISSFSKINASQKNAVLVKKFAWLKIDDWMTYLSWKSTEWKTVFDGLAETKNIQW